MAKLKDKLFFAYNEANILRLGAQLFLGIQLQETLGAEFSDLPVVSQYLHAGATTIMLLGLGLLIAPSAYSRIVEEGLPSLELHAFTSRVITIAVIPFVLGLGVDFQILITKLTSPALGAFSGLAAVTLGFLMLYGWRIRGRANAEAIRCFKEREAMRDKDSVSPGGGATLNEKIMYALMETQMILPGVQVLIGFQGGATMSQGFDELPGISKVVFVASLALLSLTMLLLMMPATFHRYVEQGEATEKFHQFTSRTLVWSMLPFGLGMCGNLFVILFKVSNSMLFAALTAFVLNAAMYYLWFGYMMVRRRQCNRYPGWFPTFHSE